MTDSRESRFAASKHIKIAADKKTDVENAEKNTASSDKMTAKKITKRNNPKYQQISAYLKKDTYKKMKMKLLDKEKDMSELLEKLIGDWNTE